MLPALIAEIATNLAALQLEPNTAAQILAAVLAPLLRSSGPELEDLQGAPKHPSKCAGRPRSRRAPRRRRRYKRRAPRPTEARERALAAVRAHPDATVSKVAKLAKVSFGTVINARKDLAKEARRARRKSKADGNGEVIARDIAEARASSAMATGHPRARPKRGSGRRSGCRQGHISMTWCSRRRAAISASSPMGRTTGTARTDSNGVTTFHDASGRVTGSIRR